MYKRLASFLFLMFFLGSSLVAQSIEFDKEIGAKHATLIEAQIGIFQDAEMSRYIEAIGNRLVAALGDQPFDYSFKILDTDIPNAFALPGGYTFVTRGLLAIINDENELAGVMAHEIIHAHKRHAIKQMKRGLLPALLKIPGAVVGLASEKIGNLLIAPVDAVSGLFDANYSRKHEREADKEGIQLMAAAGYHPQGLINCLSTLSRERVMLTGEQEKASILDDHPITPKRVNYLNKEVPGLTLDLQAPERESVKDIFDGLTFGQNPSQGIFRENIFLHPDMNLFVKFPKGWKTMNSAIDVGAIQENQNAALRITISDPTKTPKELGLALKAQLNPTYKALIVREESVTINDFDGYVISLMEKIDTVTAYIHLLWLKSGDSAYLLGGFGLEAYRESLEASAESIRFLTDEERTSINKQVIFVAKANEGETLEALGKRTGNVIGPSHTAIINGIKEKQKLKAGQEVKVVVEKPY